jgi:eukaryotic-like serine/threonine-protein kinase
MPLDGLELGRYHILRLIGSGGMGEVYLAEDTRISRQIAIKVMRNEILPYSETDSTKEVKRLFLREAKAIATLNHPHILSLFDYGENNVNDNVLTYMVMPYCPNGSLATWLRLRSNSSSQPLASQDVVQILLQAADALQYAHNQGIIHQDVKPQNFLIRGWRDSNVPDLVLSDFGLAKFISATSSTSQAIRGTPVYMAPEQWQGHPVAATDQYALAIMIYQLLTGHLPFQGGPGQVMYQHLTVPPQPPSTYTPQLSQEVDMVILTALAKKPEERFLSVSAFAGAFQQAVQDVDVQPDAQSTIPSLHMNRPTLISTPVNTNISAHPPTTTPVPAKQQSHDTHTVLASNTPTPINSGQIADLPLQQATPSPVATPSPLSIVERQAQRKQKVSKGVVLLLSLLAILLLGASVGAFLYLAKPNIPGAQSTPQANSTTATQTGANTTATSTAIAQVSDTATARTTTNTSPTGVTTPHGNTLGSGTLALDDPLVDNSRGYSWEEGLRDSGYCTFTSGVYHASIALSGYFHSCLALGKDFSDFSYQVNMTIVSGDYGGIVFRADRAATHFYYFLIDHSGNYNLKAYFDKNGDYNLIASGSSGAIDASPNAMNTLGVVAHSSSIDLYVNGQDIQSVNDGTFTHGQIGIVVLSGDAAFSDAKVWV